MDTTQITYSELKEGDVFIFNDIKSMPKRKTSSGYVDLVTGSETRDRDIPETFKNDRAWEVWDKEEQSYWTEKLGLVFVV